MESKKPTIDDLLKALQSPSEKFQKLENNKDTWRRIGEKDDFQELGIDKSELSEFLKDWISDNPYNAI